MATKTVTLIEFVDDIDGGKADRTVAFAFDGASYEIDLSKKNAAAFERALKPYLGAARRARRTRSRSTNRRQRRGTGRDLAAIRDWARANGHSVADRGRIPASVIDAYTAAQ
jgi:hypothetical protein